MSDENKEEPLYVKFDYTTVTDSDESKYDIEKLIHGESIVHNWVEKINQLIEKSKGLFSLLFGTDDTDKNSSVFGQINSSFINLDNGLTNLTNELYGEGTIVTDVDGKTVINYSKTGGDINNIKDDLYGKNADDTSISFDENGDVVKNGTTKESSPVEGYIEALQNQLKALGNGLYGSYDDKYNIYTSSDVTLTSDTVIKKGSILNTGCEINGTTYNSQTTLTEDITALAGSIITAGSIILNGNNQAGDINLYKTEIDALKTSLSTSKYGELLFGRTKDLYTSTATQINDNLESDFIFKKAFVYDTLDDEKITTNFIKDEGIKSDYIVKCWNRFFYQNTSYFYENNKTINYPYYIKNVNEYDSTNMCWGWGSNNSSSDDTNKYEYLNYYLNTTNNDTYISGIISNIKYYNYEITCCLEKNKSGIILGYDINYNNVNILALERTKNNNIVTYEIIYYTSNVNDNSFTTKPLLTKSYTYTEIDDHENDTVTVKRTDNIIEITNTNSSDTISYNLSDNYFYNKEANIGFITYVEKDTNNNCSWSNIQVIYNVNNNSELYSLYNLSNYNELENLIKFFGSGRFIYNEITNKLFYVKTIIDNDENCIYQYELVNSTKSVSDIVATSLSTNNRINGTVFNATKDITTEYWGTERTITISDYTSNHNGIDTLVDGSKNFSLYLPDTIDCNITGTANYAKKINTGTSGEGIGNSSTPVYISNNGEITPFSNNFGGETSSSIKLFYMNKGSFKNASISIGTGLNPVYITNGEVVACSESIGDNDNPIYINNGIFTRASNTIGSQDQPIYMNNGVIMATTVTIGKNNTDNMCPIYLNDGKISSATVNVGSSNQPIYMNNGSLVPLTDTIGNFAKPIYIENGIIKDFSTTIGNETISSFSPVWVKTGSITKATVTIGNETKPIWMNGGSFVQASSTVGAETKPIWMNGGSFVQASSTVGAETKPIWMNKGTLTAITSTIGGTTNPVYINAGAITACNATVGNNKTPIWMNKGTLTAITSTIGGNAKPIYLNAGAITACDATVGNSNTITYMSNGNITAGLTIFTSSATPLSTNGKNGDIWIQYIS